MKINVDNRWFFSIYNLDKAKWTTNAGSIKFETDSIKLTLTDLSKEELKKIGEMFLVAASE